MNNIHTYIYNKPLLDKNGNVQPNRYAIGVLAAKPMPTNPDLVHIGWSKVNSSAGDRFDKKRGVEIALSRSEKGSVAPVPDSILNDYLYFVDRCRRYFKDKQIWPTASI